MSRIKFLLIFTIFVSAYSAVPGALRAQIPQSDLMLATQPLSSDARGTAMGGNLISAATGIDALDYNPADLVAINGRLFTISGFNRDYSSDASFLGSPSNSTFDAGALSSVGFATKWPTAQGRFVTAISFDRVADYTSAYSFSAVNPNSSYFNTQGFLSNGTPISGPGYYNRFGQPNNQNYLGNNNLAYALGLTYDVPDSGAFSLTTPFNGGNLESGNVTTEGGLDAVRIGGAVDIAPSVSLGATLNILFGTYDLIENYTETNVSGNATDTGTAAPAGFQSASIATHLHQDQSGGSIKFGLLVDEQIVKFGLTVETPQVLHIDESFWQSGIAYFQNYPYSYASDQMANPPSGGDSYDIVTPTRFGAGASVHVAGFVGSVSASYMDMADLEITNSTFDASAENQAASDSLRGVFSYQLGAEYTIPVIGISLRAGYSFEPSPYKSDPTNYGVTAISGGLGFKLSKYVDLEAAIRISTYHTNHAIYNDYTPSGQFVSANVTDDAVSRDDMSLTFSYRY
jgi:hypothetical protein